MKEGLLHGKVVSDEMTSSVVVLFVMLRLTLWRRPDNSGGHWSWFPVPLKPTEPVLYIDGPAVPAAGCSAEYHTVAVSIDTVELGWHD